MVYFHEYDPLYRKITAIYGPNPAEQQNWVGTRFGFDDWGNYTNVLTADERQAVMAREQTAMAYDSGNRLTNWAYSHMGTPTNRWSFSWNTNWNLLASVTDPEGHKAEWDYTHGAASVERVYPATNQPAETRYAYTSNGLVAAITNANGHWTAFQHDGYGYPTAVVSQVGLTNWMAWDVLGHLKEIRLPSGDYDTNEPPNMVPRVIAFDPDELGRVRSVTYPDNSQETFAFDGIGNVTNHVDTAGRATRYVWLPTRKLASVSRFLTAGGSNQEAAIQFAYDQQFNALAIKDELGRAVERYQLDLQDRPTTVTNVENQQMTIVWGLGDKVQSLTRFDGTTASFTYGADGQVSQAVYGALTNTFTYYRNGLPKTTANALGTVSNAYDGANRLISSRLSGAMPQPHTATYGYYPAGNVSNVVTVAGTNTYAYDAGERLSSLTTTRPGLPAATFQYSYNDLNGAVSSIVYPNGVTCSYGYDSLDRLTALTWTDASNTVLRSRSYAYSAAGMITNAVYESGERVAYTLDSLDRLTGEKHTDAYGQVLSEDRYEYDLTGNRTKKTVMDAVSNALVTVNYTLGSGNRLAAWSVAETNLAGQLDVAGVASEIIGTNDRFGWLYVSNANISVKPIVSGTNFWTYDFTCGLGTQKIVAAIRDAAGNTTRVTNQVFLTVVTNGVYQHNLAGCVSNVQYKGKDYQQGLGLTWNGQCQLTAVATNGGVVERYAYDAFGRRIMTVSGGTTNWHIYDGPHVVADLDSTGAVVRSYVWGPGIDNLLAITVYGSITNTYYALKDHLNSVLALVDANGAIVEQYRYDAWGRTTVADGNGATLTASALGNRYCWQGREYSWKTGLYYFRSRWADPVTGRWLSPDPIGIAGGLNQYVMMGNNAVNFRDFSGLCAETDDDSYSYDQFTRDLWGGVDELGRALRRPLDRLVRTIHDYFHDDSDLREPPEYRAYKPDTSLLIFVGGSQMGPKGWKPVKDVPFDSHGQPVFKRGSRYLTPDVDSHKGGAWKMFDSRGNRLGTYDASGRRIGR
jgi:RHS repeat-associated protein